MPMSADAILTTCFCRAGMSICSSAVKGVISGQWTPMWNGLDGSVVLPEEPLTRALLADGMVVGHRVM